jgi:hypothetical protein
VVELSSEGGGMHEHHQGMLPVVDSVDVDKRSDVHKLHGGAIGLAGVLFLTVTGSAPITAMLLNTPISVGYGNGLYTPAGFLFATIILTIFSVGYIAMSRKVTAVGGFYSSPTRCSRRRSAAGSHSSRAASWRSTATTSRGSGARCSWCS